MTIQVGDELHPFQRQTTLEAWNRYAAVNDEFVSFHMDDEAGRAMGLPGAIGMGNLQFAYVHNLLRAWAGPNGKILRVALQYRASNRRDDLLTARSRRRRPQAGRRVDRPPDGLDRESARPADRAWHGNRRASGLVGRDRRPGDPRTIPSAPRALWPEPHGQAPSRRP